MMKLFIKTCLFSLPLILLIGIFNFYLFENKNTKFNKEGTYFIGSSRVQRSIDPQLLKKNINNKSIYNVGISGATFFHNIVLAEHLIKKFKAKKIFIELSPIKYTLQKKQILLDIYTSSILHKSVHFREYIDYTEAYLFNRLSLKNTLKKALMPNEKSSEIGYTSSEKNYYYTTDSFLKLEDLEKKYNLDITDYTSLIYYITQIAEQYSTDIQFFMPVTFHKDKEREVVSSVFQSLSNKSKVRYTNEFLNSIRSPAHLFNKNHLNAKGAKIMTNYLKNIYFSD